MRVMKSILAGSVGLAVSLPLGALACGGLFCDNSQPVNQAAERILFARNASKIDMHVRITYEGPPQNFGWLLPVPADVETTLSSEALFGLLDLNFGPRFILNTAFDENCAFAEFDGAAGGGPDAGAPPNAPGGEVQVLSREAVGPYDRVILQADNVEVLRAWLDENDFQIPEETDAKLQPYIEAGAVFVALKLLPDSDSGDVAPLRLVFTGEKPAIPIVPTAVAAEPDMGIIVHVLGGQRAIPDNYLHVQINMAAVDWINAGANYESVVSKAADEAGGKAFTTDYAGDASPLDALQPYSAAALEQLSRAANAGEAIEAVGFALDEDLARVFGDAVTPPEGVPPQQFFACPDCFGYDREAPVDGAALAARVEAEVNPVREAIVDLLRTQRYLTRLYSTMSADEMDIDPIFSFNPDLDEVANRHFATQFIFCDEEGNTLPDRSYIETPDGFRVPIPEGAMPDLVVRQDGETVRGGDVPAARVIEQIDERGQPMVVQDRTEAITARYAEGGDEGFGGFGGAGGAGGGAGGAGGGAGGAGGGAGGAGGVAPDGGVAADPGGGGGVGTSDDGCDCRATDAPSPTSLAGLAGLLLLGLRRRRA